MASLIKIGNSQGVRLPKAIIKQAHLENSDLEFEILENGVLIKPVNNLGREGWKKNLEEVLKSNEGIEDEGQLEDFLDDGDLESFEW